ncbi:MAG: hypothetical protein HY675_27935 [Chloroflexi bacterium]|nr:hypothetical protein [Candidatus Methylomirabilis oxyfera]MBI4322341.1 hypothetical protein [Chloroflexota bacterium]
MSNKFIEDLSIRLAQRSKRQLIEGMISRTPHQVATEKAVAALQVYPLLLLLLAHDYPTKVWILDKGEKPSSAAILSPRVRRKRWHSTCIGVDDCEGLTDVVDSYVAMVVSWKTLLVMRHEFAHVVTTFFSPATRRKIERLYVDARAHATFTEPLAGESLGEYIACAMSYYFFPDLREELLAVDPALYNAVDEILGQAELVSQRIGQLDMGRVATPEPELNLAR